MDQPSGVRQDTRPYFGAAEVERFAYCPLSWWLERQGHVAQGDEVEQGVRSHQEHAGRIGKVLSGEEEIRQLELSVLLFAVIGTILAVFGLSFLPLHLDDRFQFLLAAISGIWLLAATVFLFLAETISSAQERLTMERVVMAFSIVAVVIILTAVFLTTIASPVLAFVLQVVAVVWVVGASVFFYLMIRRARANLLARTDANLGEDAITYVDGQEELVNPPKLRSEWFGLVGRPDLVLVRGSKRIPVEFKTGRVPAGPHWSHIMQLTAYCRLVEEQWGTPPFGIIRYGQGSATDFPIPYDERNRADLLHLLERMSAATASREVHRNHNRPGKCRNCSRRDGCPERLDTEGTAPTPPYPREERPLPADP